MTSRPVSLAARLAAIGLVASVGAFGCHRSSAPGPAAGVANAPLAAVANPVGNRKPYETCDPPKGQNCVAGSVCLSFPKEHSRCFQECSKDADCTAVASSRCVLNNQKLCAVSCASDAGSVCPTGSTCDVGMGKICL